MLGAAYLTHTIGQSRSAMQVALGSERSFDLFVQACYDGFRKNGSYGWFTVFWDQRD